MKRLEAEINEKSVIKLATIRDQAITKRMIFESFVSCNRELAGNPKSYVKINEKFTI
jgi:hypothetical protein